MSAELWEDRWAGKWTVSVFACVCVGGGIKWTSCAFIMVNYWNRQHKTQSRWVSVFGDFVYAWRRCFSKNNKPHDDVFFSLFPLLVRSPLTTSMINLILNMHIYPCYYDPLSVSSVTFVCHLNLNVSRISVVLLPHFRSSALYERCHRCFIVFCVTIFFSFRFSIKLPTTHIATIFRMRIFIRLQHVPLQRDKQTQHYDSTHTHNKFFTLNRKLKCFTHQFW